MTENNYLSKLKIYIDNKINFESLPSNEKNQEIISFVSELKNKDNNKIVSSDIIHVFFGDMSKIDSSKAMSLIESIVKKDQCSFWPQKDDLIGRCKIVNLSGQGFTSNVYKAIHEFLGIEVAVKILSDNLKNDNPNIETMFLQEARNTAKLRHNNLVSIFDADKGDKYTYMIMEFVDGSDLEKFLNDNGILYYKDAISMMIKICDALSYALENGIIHRDIKPGNIMVSKKLEVKLLDLGLSKIVNTRNNLESDSMVGTPLYMSPEQFIDSSSVDHRADLYSLGATFYHLITGQPPFETKSYREIITQKIASDDFMPKFDGDNYPDEIKVIITKLMQKDINLRYQSYELLKNDLIELIL